MDGGTAGLYTCSAKPDGRKEHAMIDYITLLLVNMVAGLVVLALFLWWGLGQTDYRHWAPAFGIAGLLGTVGGLHMAFTWPVPAPYSSAYGEMSALLGVLFLGAAWAIARGWRLLPLGLYAFFPGVAAILIGVRMIHLGLTALPLMTGAGFIVTGMGGVFAAAAIWKQNMRMVRILGGLVMLGAAALWVPTAYMSYWVHMKVEQPASAQTDNGQATAANSKEDARGGGDSAPTPATQ